MPLSTPIVQIIDRDPVTIDVHKKVSDAARILSAGRFHHLPVVTGQRLVGMISPVDLFKLSVSVMDDDKSASLDFLDKHYQLDDVMQKDVISVSHRATVGDAARLLSAGGFHAVPVIDADEHLVGIVTTTDLIELMLKAPTHSDLPASVQQRLQVLEQVFSAAQSYLLSGMAITEHEELERRIEAARRAA